MKKFLSFSIVFALFMTAFVKPSFAVQTPTFDTCSSPTWPLRVSYQTGMHGVIGIGLLPGSDFVYEVAPNDVSLVTQCYCPEEGTGGIQTNWWRVDALSQTDVDDLVQSQGWFYIPDGSLWGLDPLPYVAQNSEFACSEGTPTPTNIPTPTPTDGPTPTEAPTPIPGSTGGSSSGGDAVSGASYEVLKLAETGNAATIAVLALGGLLSLLSGFGLRMFRNK